MADNKEIIKCPACGADMEKVYMEEQGVNLDVCPECGGIYFDNRELQRFDEQHESIEPLEKLFENRTFINVDQSMTRICPVCGMKMVKNYSSVKKEVQIDECYSCGGKFLDYGELQKIREQYPTEEARANDVVRDLYEQVGIELREQKEKHENLKASSSFLTKFLKMRNK